MRQQNFFATGPNFTNVQQGIGCSWSLAIWLFDCSLHFRSKSKVV